MAVSGSINELPSHIVLDILTCGRLSALDLVCVELSSSIFVKCQGLYPSKFRSLVDMAASQLCVSDPIFDSLSADSKKELFDRCGGNWKRVLRFLHSVQQASDTVDTSVGNKMQIKSGRYHTLLISNSSVYSCGSSLCGVLGQGPEITQCNSFRRIIFPSSTPVVQVSASHNHAAFVTQCGEVFSCGDNSFHCCGHKDATRPIFRPLLVEALKGIPCKQVATGLNFTIFLTREGQVYTCGTNSQGQLGHGDTADRPIPTIVEELEGVGPIVQISAGPSYALAVAQDGTLYSFGSGTNLCLGHGEQHNEHHPRPILSFRREGVHIVRVSAGDEHVVALDACGYVYTWGKGYCGALGHGDEIDKTTPAILSSLKNHIAVQVCACKRKTFVLLDSGLVYSFGWMAFGSLGFTDRGVSDKVTRPRVLDNLRAHHVSQISTAPYHTFLITSRGQIFGFGDNEKAQLGHDSFLSCRKPTEIFVDERALAVIDNS